MQGEGALKATKRVHLESLARQGDIVAEATLAAIPELPVDGAYLWAWFIDMAATRQNNGMGVGRLSRLEIQAWEADEMVALSHWERRVVLSLDAAFVASTIDEPAKPAQEIA